MAFFLPPGGIDGVILKETETKIEVLISSTEKDTIAAPSSPPHPPAHKKQDDKDSRHPQVPDKPSSSHPQSESNSQCPVSVSTQLRTARYL